MEIIFLFVVLGGVGLILLARGSAQNQEVDAIAAGKAGPIVAVEGFVPAIVFEGMVGSYGLAIDPASEQLAIIILGHEPRVYHFSQLVAAEVDRDGETITTTKGKIDTSGAAVATALIGPLGMALGAKTSSTSISKTVITKLALKLYFSDLYTPCFEIPFTTPWMPATEFANAASNLDNWYGRVRTILVGIERQGGAIDQTGAVAHSAPAPVPEHPNAGKSWVARTFGA